MERLLTREQFKSVTLGRCQGLCCVPDCGRPAVDAHHILERRLWPDGGYYASNGAPLCSEHHLDAETTKISVGELRRWCGIDAFVLPPQLVQGDDHDKWGNPIMANGMRLRGELFHDEAAQKALALGGMLGMFTTQVKHPRTPHLPGSPGATSDDRILESLEQFRGKRVIMTEKMDGECTTLTRDTMHARSLDSRHHPSRDWVKSLWSGYWAMDIPEGWRVVGENLYARHSVSYDELPSYFLGFNLWEGMTCRSWDETVEWFSLIGAAGGRPIQSVPVLYDGLFDEKVIDRVWSELLAKDRAAAAGGPVRQREGYVVRVAGAFAYRDFATNVGKFVRANHVTTSTHWLHEAITANGLSGGER